MALQDKSVLTNLPVHPGVYFMLGAAREILYIGKARSLKHRVSSYFNSNQQSIKTQHLLANVVDIEVTMTNTEHEALLLECVLIKQHQPKYNILLRDDKTYPYILLSNDSPYPRLSFYRGRRKPGVGRYFGPYANSYVVRETINLVQKIFNLRTCDNSTFANRSRPCLQYQINLCSAPCTKFISQDLYNQNLQHAVLFLQGKTQEVFKYLQNKMAVAAAELKFEVAAKIRDQLAYLATVKEQKILSPQPEDADVIGLARSAGMACIEFMLIREGLLWNKHTYFSACQEHDVTEEILTAIISQHYLGEDLKNIPQRIIISHELPEQKLLADALTINYRVQGGKEQVKIFACPKGRRKEWLTMATKNAELALQNRVLTKAHLAGKFVALQQLLSLPALPQRIECMDISHSMGESPVASCVVFTPNGPLKPDYRAFNISGITLGDDLAAMRQGLMKRFAKYLHNEPLALLIIDGGCQQLAVAKQVLAELQLNAIPVLGVAKGEGRKPGLETLYFNSTQPLNLPSDSPALHLIQQIRDEAHRFAVSNHRRRRDKKRLNSGLLAVQGLGKVKVKALLQHFGDMAGVMAATSEQLQQVSGITKQLAVRIVNLRKIIAEK